MRLGFRTRAQRPPSFSDQPLGPDTPQLNTSSLYRQKRFSISTSHNKSHDGRQHCKLVMCCLFGWFVYGGISDSKLPFLINVLGAFIISEFWQPGRFFHMTKCRRGLRLIDFYLIYVNILVMMGIFPLKVSICVRKGSETAKKHDFLIFRPKIVIFGLSGIMWEKFPTIRGLCHITNLECSYGSQNNRTVRYSA